MTGTGTDEGSVGVDAGANLLSAGAPRVAEPRFVADVMLGRLARWLRALGCDTLYAPSVSDARLLGVSLRDGRCLLTRDVALARRAAARGLLVRGDTLDEQLRQVVDRYGLSGRNLLTRCLECNVVLERIEADHVRGQVPPYTLATQRDFRRCAACRRVYWPGTHAVGIQARLRPYLEVSARRGLGSAEGPSGPSGEPASPNQGNSQDR